MELDIKQHMMIVYAFVLLCTDVGLRLTGATSCGPPLSDAQRLESFRTWASSKDYLKDVPDSLIDRFALRNKEDNDSLLLCKRDLLEHFKIQHELPSIFRNRTLAADPSILNTMKVINVFKLPKPDLNGNAVIFLSLATNASFFVNDSLKLFNLVVDYALKDQETKGISILIDMEKVTIMALKCAGSQLTELRAFGRYMKMGLPATLQSVHMLKCDPMISSLLGLLYTTLGQDKIHKIFFKWKTYTPDNVADLYPEVPKENLPQDYGGSEKTVVELASEQYTALKSFDGNEPEIDEPGIVELRKDLDALAEEINKNQNASLTVDTSFLGNVYGLTTVPSNV